MIYSDVTITVKGNTATLDNDLFLYKNDKNITINISIVNSIWNFAKKLENNIIEKTEATFFTLRWMKGDKVKKVFEEQQIKKGKCEFVITEELIDEDIEMGDYDFQISLLDEEKNSILSIPPVIEQIHINKHIFEDEDINTVGNAKVGIAKVGTYEQRSTENSEGLYNKKTWQDNEVITKEDLNTIEEGIYNNSTQCKDIAKRTIVENNKLYLVKADGTKLDEGTTLPTSSESVDLSNYVTKEDGKGLSTNDYTTAEKEKLAILENYNDTDIKEKINNKADKNEFYYNYKQAKAKNVVAIFLDDVTDDLYTNREKFKTRGIKITGGLRLDGVSDSGFSPSVSSDGGVSFPTTYAHIKELQDDYGIDFAYHGTKHGNNWGTTWSISEDINAFLESTSQHGIKIMGYIGPNGANLPYKSKDKFLWRRNGMTGNTTAKPSMFFYPEDHINLDTIKTASIFESIKKSIDTLATKEGHVLALTGHVPIVINLDNFWSLIDYIISKGIDIITATEARMRYGYAIARLPEKTMIDDILDISGKGNYVLPNYFAMTESGVIKSNYCPVRWIDVSNINNANINNIENFEFGTTIVSSGSIDLMNGIPTVGTTFINRYGKNGEDFMIYRAYNDAGLFFRDVKTRQRWDKFAIVSTTVPTSPTATGYIGEMAVDTNYLYVCIASNSWIRIAKDSTWE